MRLFFLGVLAGFGLAYWERAYIHKDEDKELLRVCKQLADVATSCCNSATVSAQTALQTIHATLGSRGILVGER